MRALLTAALLAIAWPATAHAVTYGGGTPADSVESAQRQLTLVGIRIDKAGEARVWVTVAARCGAAPVAAVPVTPNPDGSFAFRRTERDRPGGGVVRTTRIRMAGVVAGKLASGTVSAKLSFRRHGRVTAKCSTGTRSWQARLPSVLGAPAAARPNVAYYGFTSQAGEPRRPFPIVLKVNATGNRIATVAFDYRFRCRSGKSFELDDITPGAPIVADGTFQIRERFTLHYAEGNERFRVEVGGRLQADGVSGGLHVRSVLRSRRTGRVLDRCTTGSGQSYGASP